MGRFSKAAKADPSRTTSGRLPTIEASYKVRILGVNAYDGDSGLIIFIEFRVLKSYTEGGARVGAVVSQGMKISGGAPDQIRAAQGEWQGWCQNCLPVVYDMVAEAFGRDDADQYAAGTGANVPDYIMEWITCGVNERLDKDSARMLMDDADDHGAQPFAGTQWYVDTRPRLKSKAKGKSNPDSGDYFNKIVWEAVNPDEYDDDRDDDRGRIADRGRGRSRRDDDDDDRDRRPDGRSWARGEDERDDDDDDEERPRSRRRDDDEERPRSRRRDDDRDDRPRGRRLTRLPDDDDRPRGRGRRR